MKTNYLNIKKALLLFSFTLIYTLSFSQVTIKKQGFEGLAADNLNYSVSSSNVSVTSSTSISGSKSLEFGTGSTNAVFDNIDLSGYSSVKFQ